MWKPLSQSEGGVDRGWDLMVFSTIRLDSAFYYSRVQPQCGKSFESKVTTKSLDVIVVIPYSCYCNLYAVLPATLF